MRGNENQGEMRGYSSIIKWTNTNFNEQTIVLENKTWLLTEKTVSLFFP